MRKCFFTLAVGLMPLAASAVTIDLATVGNTNNAADSTGYGSVGYSYQIGKYEVFNNQYAEFLNAVADTDTYGLYNTSMSSDARGGIDRSGSSGSYTYSAKTGYENMPVVFVSFYDAVRFANWLENDQPTGVQDATTTEAGSYTLFTSGGTTTNVSARASGGWGIPTENEWYKAAYHQPSGAGGPGDSYWLYPMQTDSAPYSDQPPGTSSPDAAMSGNFYRDDGSANGYNDGYARTGSPSFNTATNYLTDVGAYTTADSYYGTFDQGGNVWEWNGATIGSNRGLRGGDWVASEDILRSSFRTSAPALDETYSISFRVAIPEPSSVAGVLIAALGLCARWRRKRRRYASSAAILRRT